MAIYHLSLKTFARAAGQSVVAAAAYRAGARIKDERTGIVHDFRRKRGVVSSELVLPVDSPEWANDRSLIWNAAEAAETRKNSKVGREFELALPAELNADDRAELARSFARELVQRHQCAVEISIHAPGKGGDNRNFHAHVLISTRRLTKEGFSEKTRELDDRKSGSDLVNHWRERFAELQNQKLHETGVKARVDHRSLAAQGVDRVPTTHLGPAATALSRKSNQKIERVERREDLIALNLLIQDHKNLKNKIQTTKFVLTAEEVLKMNQPAKKSTAVTHRAHATPDIDCGMFDADDVANEQQEQLERNIRKRKRLNEEGEVEISRNARHKAKLWAEFYDRQLDRERWGHLHHLMLSRNDLVVKTSDNGTVVDKGRKIELKNWTDMEFELAFEMAHAKGIKNLCVYGREEFQILSARRAAAEGWPLECISSSKNFNLADHYLEFLAQSQRVVEAHDERYVGTERGAKESDSLFFPAVDESFGSYFERLSFDWEVVAQGALPDLDKRERRVVARHAAKSYFDRVTSPDPVQNQASEAKRRATPSANAESGFGDAPGAA